MSDPKSMQPPAQPHTQTHATTDDPRWLDKPGSVDLLIKILIFACVASVLADFTYHKHGEFHFQEFPGFDAIFGFLSYVGLVNLAKLWRKVVMRGEDYYD